MNNATPQLSHAPPQPASPRSGRSVQPRRGSASLQRSTWTELFDEQAAMIGAPAFFGPPIGFVLGPWLLLVLLLIGPFAVLFTGLLLLAVAAGLVTVFVAVIASPFLLIRRLYARGRIDANGRPQLPMSRKHRISSSPVVSLQPKGMS